MVYKIKLMTFVPKYQWLTEFKQHPCNDACDIVQIDADTDKKFQVSFTPTVLLNEDFDGNNIAYPMEEISVNLGSGSGTTIAYGIDFTIDTTNDNHFINSYSFFYDGQPYCYVFCRDASVSTEYSITEYGNFKLVKVRGKESGDYAQAFNFYLNDFGIYAIVNSPTSLTVYGFPENTQVQYEASSPPTNGIGTATWISDNFLPINNQICFFQLNGLDEYLPPISQPSITKNLVVGASKRMIFTINYTNSFADAITLYIYIRDESFSLLDGVSAVLSSGTNTITFNYETSATPPTSYNFQFLLDPSSGEIADSEIGFCFNSIKIETIAQLQAIEVQGCTTANVPFTEDYNDLYNSLITMNIGSLPNGLITTGKWKLILTDDESNTWTSIIYETIDGTNCTNRNLMRLVWTSDCKFADIDYLNLPFENDIYVKGYSTSQPLDNKERVINTLSSGELEMIYNYSLEKKEFTFGVYTESFYRTLQRAFEHKTITIDGVQYKQDSDSVLTKKPEGQKYSARIELVESGSEVIITNCCC